MSIEQSLHNMNLKHIKNLLRFLFFKNKLIFWCIFSSSFQLMKLLFLRMLRVGFQNVSGCFSGCFWLFFRMFLVVFQDVSGCFSRCYGSFLMTFLTVYQDVSWCVLGCNESFVRMFPLQWILLDCFPILPILLRWKIFILYLIIPIPGHVTPWTASFTIYN